MYSRQRDQDKDTYENMDMLAELLPLSWRPILVAYWRRWVFGLGIHEQRQAVLAQLPPMYHPIFRAVQPGAPLLNRWARDHGFPSVYGLRRP